MVTSDMTWKSIQCDQIWL